MSDIVPSPPVGRPTRRRRSAPSVLAAALAAGALVAAAPAGAQQVEPSTKDTTGARSSKKPEKPKRTVSGELTKLERADEITSEQRGVWRTSYLRARSEARRMSKGTARRELEGVIANTEDIAGAGKLDAAVAPSVFLTLQVNRDRWRSGEIPPVGSRPAVPGSPLVWQYYGGEGLQIQWLATFGLANALSTTKTPAKADQQRAILDEAVRLAGERAGGPAWLYLFDFGGGAPPWGSGMAQVTGMQALVRGAQRFDEQRYRTVALDAVALLRRRSPTGSVLKAESGDHQLLYTFSRLRVLNAFAQAVSGLHEVAAATNDGKVTGAYVRAERELRAELPRYAAKGSWTRYSLGGRNATPSYHRLARDLVRGLCRTLTADAAAFAEGRAVAGRRAPAPAGPYCAAAERWTEGLETTPNGPGSSSRRGATGRSAPAPAADPAAGLAAPELGRP